MATSRIPFKRVNQAFDEMARARLCQSSGSEYSAENSADLSDLINSFIERSEVGDEDEGDDNVSDSEISSYPSYNTSVNRNEVLLLRSLLGYGGDSDKEIIRSETELACKLIGIGTEISSQEGFKRQLMNRLRQRGLDAGLCKSRWKKAGQFPSGDYEYIDVMIERNRYIVEVNLAKEFTIARPSSHYESLLEAFPEVFVGKSDDLKEVVKLMGSAVRKSMKTRDMHVAPWRRNGYMLAKWFSSYKRTTNADIQNSVKESEDLRNKRSVGFEMALAPVAVAVGFGYCRGEVVRKPCLRVGRLAQVIGGGGSTCN